jgi:hypothetical protein
VTLIFVFFVAVLCAFALVASAPILVDAWEQGRNAISSKDWGAVTRLALRAFLWVLLVPVILVAALFLIVGTFFGFALWDLHNPSPTVLWMTVVLSPLFLLVGLNWSKSSTAKSAVFAAVAVLVVATVGAVLLG